MTILGDRIKKLRKKHNLTQDEVADLIGKKRSNFSAYETGRTVPPSNTLDKLASIFNTTTDYLLGKTDVNLYDWVPNKEENSNSNEKKFLNELELSDKELLERFNLKLDGKELSKEEAKSIIAYLRYHRNS